MEEKVVKEEPKEGDGRVLVRESTPVKDGSEAGDQEQCDREFENDDDDDVPNKRKYEKANSEEINGNIEGPQRKKMNISEWDSEKKSEGSQGEKYKAKVNSEGLVEDLVYIPTIYTGRLIGRQGDTINYIQNETGTKLQIDHNSRNETTKVVVLGPTEKSIERVKGMIEDVIKSDVAPVIPGEILSFVDCPQDAVGRIIGRKGETIRSLQQASKAKIVVDQNFPEGKPKQVRISGKPSVVNLAIKMVKELIEKEPASVIGIINKYTKFGDASCAIDCPKSLIGRVIGKGGDTIKHIQKMTGAVVFIQQDTDPCQIKISGNSMAVEYCSAWIGDIARGGNPYYNSPNSSNFASKRTGPCGPMRNFHHHPSVLRHMSHYYNQQHGFHHPRPHHPPARSVVKTEEYLMGHHGRYPFSLQDRYDFYNRFDYPPPQLPNNFSYNMPEPMAREYDESRNYYYGQYRDYEGYRGAGGSGEGRIDEGFSMSLRGEEARDIEYERYLESCGGWRELRDTEGRPYYYNTQNGASQWEKPLEFR